MDLSAGGMLSPSESDLAGGPSAKLGRCPHRPPHRKYWWTRAGHCRQPTAPGCCSQLYLLAMLAGGGHCPHPTLTLPAQMARL